MIIIIWSDTYTIFTIVLITDCQVISTLMTILKYISFHWNKCIWEWYVQNVSHLSRGQWVNAIKIYLHAYICTPRKHFSEIVKNVNFHLNKCIWNCYLQNASCKSYLPTEALVFRLYAHCMLPCGFVMRWRLDVWTGVTPPQYRQMICHTLAIPQRFSLLISDMNNVFSQTTQPFSNCPHTCCKSMILDPVCEHDGAILALPSSTATISSSVGIPAASASPLLPSVLKELSWFSLSDSTSSNASSKVTIPCLSLLSLLIRWDLAKAFLDINLPFFLTECILPPTNKMCLHLKG